MELFHTFHDSKKILSILPIAFLLTLAFSFIPVAHAYGSGDNWQIGASGTGSLCIAPGVCGGFGFWGWCAFAGVAGGTDGDCQFSQYLHQGTPLGTVQCQTSIDVTNWGISGTTGTFVINSGSVTFHPASSTPACIGFLAGAGFFLTQTGPNTASFIAPSDTGIPAAPNHYNFNGAQQGPITYTELQFQVSFNPH